jgi:dethiobiotin synthetase
MTRGFFVTGTGTGVGKTFITALLAEQARAAGQRVFAFKPIETGCRLVDGRRIGDDQELLARAAGNWQRDELRNLYCFERPVSPRAAARAEDQVIELERIRSVFDRGAEQADFVLVEGAGGWRVPISDELDMANLAACLALPVLVVATAGLGTINHSVLTVEAVKRDGCELAAVILSIRPEDDPEFAEDNAAEISRVTRARVRVSHEKVLYDTL